MRRLLHLAEDLRLADHHRVEARRDAEEMAHGFATPVGVEAARQLVGPEPMRVGEKRRQLGRDRSGSRPQATTSTRLQVETITPSFTPGSETSPRSAGSSRPSANATRSRTSTGAVW